MTNAERKLAARWQDVVNFLLGLWFFISPWVLGFGDTKLLATNAWVFGIIIMGLALGAILAYRKWEEWLEAAIGVWVFVSPWVLGAASNPRVLASSIIVGALLVILALLSAQIDHGQGRLISKS